MTDKEAFELLLKYCGGEKGLTMIKNMIHLVGLHGAVSNMEKLYEKEHGKMPTDFKDWVYQSFRYLQQNQTET